MLPFFLLFISIVILYFGAEFTLGASEKIGSKLKLSPLIVGMILIGFGTSLPEMFVGHIAAFEGKFGISIGSLVGSNIANMFLVLGVCALMVNLSVKAKSIKSHLLIHLLLYCVMAFVLLQNNLTILSAIPLFTVCGIYIYVIFKDMTGSKTMDEIDHPIVLDHPLKLIFQLAIGFILLFLGGELLVYSGTKLTLSLGMSEYVISSIFIAFGTSFPELVTALLAAYKKKNTELIVGNIIGSNLFNCGFVLASLSFYNIEFKENFQVELISLILGGAILVLASFLKKDLGRLIGFLFLALYGLVVMSWIKVI